MKKILVTMMVLALTIGAQAQQYDGINTYTYDYGLSGRTTMLRATFSHRTLLDFNNAVKFLAEPSGEAERNKVIFVGFAFVFSPCQSTNKFVFGHLA